MIYIYIPVATSSPCLFCPSQVSRDATASHCLINSPESVKIRIFASNGRFSNFKTCPTAVRGLNGFGNTRIVSDADGRVGVAVGVGVEENVGVAQIQAVPVGVGEKAGVRVAVTDGVNTGETVMVRVNVMVGVLVGVMVGVALFKGVAEPVGVGV